MGAEFAAAVRELGRTDHGSVAMLEFLDRVAVSETLLAIVAEILADGQQISEIAGRSVRHANGFEKLVLIAAHSAQIRLHIWWPAEPGQERPIENAHNHRWSFATTLLAGAYHATAFEHQDGDGHFRFQYHKQGIDAASEYDLLHVGTASLVPTSVTQYVAGSSYWLDSRVVHRVSPVEHDKLTVTLVITSPPHRDNTDVFVPRETSLQVVGDTRHEPLTPADVTASLERIRAHLTSRQLEQ